MVNNSESHSTQLLKESPVGSRSTGPHWELVDNTHWFFFDFPILLYQLFYSCFLGLTVPNYFYFVTGSVFFFLMGNKLRQLNWHIIEQLVKRPNFHEEKVHLYQLIYKSYLETYVWVRTYWPNSRVKAKFKLLGSQSLGEISRKTTPVLVEESWSHRCRGEAGRWTDSAGPKTPELRTSKETVCCFL